MGTVYFNQKRNLKKEDFYFLRKGDYHKRKGSSVSRDSVWKILVPYVFFISDQWPINTIATFHFCLQIRKIWTGQNCPTIFIAFFGVGELNWLGLVSCCQWQLTRRLVPIGIKVSLSLSPLMIFFSLHLLIGWFSHFVLDYHHALLPLQCSQVWTQQYTCWIQKIYSHYKPKKKITNGFGLWMMVKKRMSCVKRTNN